MRTVLFRDVPLGTKFFDFAYSGDWLVKATENSANGADWLAKGFEVCVAPACPVMVPEHHQSELVH